MLSGPISSPCPAVSSRLRNAARGPAVTNVAQASTARTPLRPTGSSDPVPSSQRQISLAVGESLFIKKIAGSPWPTDRLSPAGSGWAWMACQAR